MSIISYNKTNTCVIREVFPYIVHLLYDKKLKQFEFRVVSSDPVPPRLPNQVKEVEWEHWEHGWNLILPVKERKFECVQSEFSHYNGRKEMYTYLPCIWGCVGFIEEFYIGRNPNPRNDGNNWVDALCYYSIERK